MKGTIFKSLFFIIYVIVYFIAIGNLIGQNILDDNIEEFDAIREIELTNVYQDMDYSYILKLSKEDENLIDKSEFLIEERVF